MTVGSLKVESNPHPHPPNPPISTSSQGANVPWIVKGLGKLSFAINIKYLVGEKYNLSRKTLYFCSLRHGVATALSVPGTPAPADSAYLPPAQGQHGSRVCPRFFVECGRRKSEASGDVRKTVRKNPDVTASTPLGPTGDASQYSQRGQS